VVEPGLGSVAGIGAVLILALLARQYDLADPAGRKTALTFVQP
jgi:hypothetical protein